MYTVLDYSWKLLSDVINGRGRWFPATTPWRVLRFRMEERPPIWRVDANILNKQSRAGDKM
jgi:hypothetical protein